MNTATLSPVTVGQEAYVLGRDSNTKVTVLKVTPTGRVVVGNKERWGEATATFDAQPNHRGTRAEYGASAVHKHDYRTLTLDVAGVEAEAARKLRTIDASRAFDAVKDAAPSIRWECSKERMLELVAELEAKVAAARAAVEAI